MKAAGVQDRRTDRQTVPPPVPGVLASQALFHLVLRPDLLMLLIPLRSAPVLGLLRPGHGTPVPLRASHCAADRSCFPPAPAPLERGVQMLDFLMTGEAEGFSCLPAAGRHLSDPLTHPWLGYMRL